jgi:PhnB protein
MAAKITPVPEGYGTLTPYLIVPDGAAALEFYTKVFGATVGEKLTSPEGASCMRNYRSAVRS